MMDCWREAFWDPELPFVVIQIADYIERPDAAWKRLQQAQWDVQFLRENVKTIPCRDICEANNIHPSTKSVLAARIAEHY